MRLDQHVAEALGVSRNRAQFFVEHGLVSLLGKQVRKCGLEIVDGTQVEIDMDHPQIRYVSRSAEKLASFLDASGISVVGFECLDVGASTGGFTQVLLERGATRVTAVDVGTSQLHERLQGDARIISLENTDIRSWNSSERFVRIVVDVSFISLREVLPAILRFLAPEGICILLFKPQFEVGPTQLKKTGIPKSEEVRLQSVRDFESWLVTQSVSILTQKESSLIGEAGNREVLFAVSASKNIYLLSESDIIPT